MSFLSVCRVAARASAAPVAAVRRSACAAAASSASSAPLGRCFAPAAASASSVRSLLAVSFAPRRSLHCASLALGGGGHHDAAHGSSGFHGTDFLTRDNVERRVMMILSDVEKIDKTKLQDPNSSFRDLGLDSLDEVEVVMMLEDEFVIDIQDEVAGSILTVQDAINYITQHPFAANDEVHH